MVKIRGQLEYELEELVRAHLAEALGRLPPEDYQDLAIGTCGAIDPHHADRARAARALALTITKFSVIKSVMARVRFRDEW